MVDMLGDGRYAIRVVEHLTGLTARQIRYYEAKGLFVPQRTAGRQRLFSTADVQRLQWIRACRSEGATLAAIKARLQGGHPDAGRMPSRERDMWGRLARPGSIHGYTLADRGRSAPSLSEHSRSTKAGGH